MDDDDWKLVVSSLTKVSSAAYQRAQEETNSKRRALLTTAQFLRCVLDDPKSDFAVLLASQGANVAPVQAVLDVTLSGVERGTGTAAVARPFAKLMRAAGVERGAAVKARSGVMLALLGDDPNRFDATGLKRVLEKRVKFPTIAEIEGGLLAASDEEEDARQPSIPRRARWYYKHAVEEGETLEAIAARYLVDLETLAIENHLVFDAATLERGQILKISVLPEVLDRLGLR